MKFFNYTEINKNIYFKIYSSSQNSTLWSEIFLLNLLCWPIGREKRFLKNWRDFRLLDFPSRNENRLRLILGVSESGSVSSFRGRFESPNFWLFETQVSSASFSYIEWVFLIILNMIPIFYNSKDTNYFYIALKTTMRRQRVRGGVSKALWYFCVPNQGMVRLDPKVHFFAH